MSAVEYRKALHVECRENAAFAHAMAVSITNADRRDAVLLASRPFRLAVLTRSRSIQKNRAAREKREAYTSLGLVRVKGAMGGTYYE